MIIPAKGGISCIYLVRLLPPIILTSVFPSKCAIIDVPGGTHKVTVLWSH